MAAEYMGEGAVTPHCGPAANGGSRLGMTVFTLIALIAAGTFAFKVSYFVASAASVPPWPSLLLVRRGAHLSTCQLI